MVAQGTPVSETEYATILEVLQRVKDPEIPTVSLVELGVIEDVLRLPDGTLHVALIPTFAGCPAIEFMRLQVAAELSAAGIAPAVVTIDKTRPWSSDRITERGRALLKAYGLAPPPVMAGELTLEALSHVECPKCDSTDTELLNPFGPTLCRAMHHCHNCHETFEQFKPL
jgi:ring-1,2-phenylacetyl-CoA epoxidase subunit PaaD